MMMGPMKRKIETTDLLPMDVYSTERKRLRAQVVAKKRNRRVEVGPFATFYFENFETMLSQVHEMLFIERGGEDGVIGGLGALSTGTRLLRADIGVVRPNRETISHRSAPLAGWASSMRGSASAPMVPSSSD